MTRLIPAILLLVALPARAHDLRVPPGMMLCHRMEDAAAPRHPGCWLAPGGQRVEIIAALPTYAQLRLWSTEGDESLIVYAMRVDVDNIQKGSK